MDKTLMQFLHPERKPNAKFKLGPFGDAEFEMRVLGADEMASISAEVQSKGLKGVEALYPAVAASLVTPNLRSADLLDALSEREGRKILSPVDALKAIFTGDEVAALIGIYNDHADVTINFEEKVKEAKN
ncbi:MAG: hypothetical protein KID04_14590 [Clostridium sp.]|nr:hypothetical protein [Clostridium sp.]DAI95643.1 MAG TPA: tail assembly chaperone protein [Caudoviricetes sp.]